MAFGAGVTWAAIQMVFQSAQVALAMVPRGDVAPALARMISDLTYALSVIAYIPITVMLAAVAVVSLRPRAFPAWLALCGRRGPNGAAPVDSESAHRRR